MQGRAEETAARLQEDLRFAERLKLAAEANIAALQKQVSAREVLACGGAAAGGGGGGGGCALMVVVMVMVMVVVVVVMVVIFTMKIIFRPNVSACDVCVVCASG